MRYTKKRSYLWSPGMAYCVGLMTSDGCLQKDGRHLDITSVDYEQLTNFRLALGRPELVISRKYSGVGKTAFRIQFSDTALYDFLLDAGLVPNKSKILGPLCIPENFYADFLRGVFDGDGTVYGYTDKRWKNSHMHYTGFASASPAFLDYIRTQNSRLIGTGQGSVRNAARAACLCYAKKDTRSLYDFMYYSPDNICLDRKQKKMKSFIFGT